MRFVWRFPIWTQIIGLHFQNWCYIISSHEPAIRLFLSLPLPLLFVVPSAFVWSAFVPCHNYAFFGVWVWVHAIKLSRKNWCFMVHIITVFSKTMIHIAHTAANGCAQCTKSMQFIWHLWSLLKVFTRLQWMHKMHTRFQNSTNCNIWLHRIVKRWAEMKWVLV